VEEEGENEGELGQTDRGVSALGTTTSKLMTTLPDIGDDA
jgi:hypothetical protein